MKKFFALLLAALLLLSLAACGKTPYTETAGELYFPGGEMALSEKQVQKICDLVLGENKTWVNAVAEWDPTWRIALSDCVIEIAENGNVNDYANGRSRIMEKDEFEAFQAFLDDITEEIPITWNRVFFSDGKETHLSLREAAEFRQQFLNKDRPWTTNPCTCEETWTVTLSDYRIEICTAHKTLRDKTNHRNCTLNGDEWTELMQFIAAVTPAPATDNAPNFTTSK